MTPDAAARNSLRTRNELNHAGHISVLRSVFSHLEQGNSSRGQDSAFARDILSFYGRKSDTMLCLTSPLCLYCDGGDSLWQRITHFILDLDVRWTVVCIVLILGLALAVRSYSKQKSFFPEPMS
jgi:hypothetical protein